MSPPAQPVCAGRSRHLPPIHLPGAAAFQPPGTATSAAAPGLINPLPPPPGARSLIPPGPGGRWGPGPAPAPTATARPPTPAPTLTPVPVPAVPQAIVSPFVAAGREPVALSSRECCSGSTGQVSPGTCQAKRKKCRQAPGSQPRSRCRGPGFSFPIPDEAHGTRTRGTGLPWGQQGAKCPGMEKDSSESGTVGCPVIPRDAR